MNITQEFILQRSKNEPEWIVNKRLEALKSFNEFSIPSIKEEEWRYTNVSNLKINNLLVNLNGFKMKLSQIPEELKRRGVVFTDILTAFQENLDILKEYFLKQIRIDNKFLALHSALINSGFLLYVPKNVEIRDVLNVSIFSANPTNIFNHSIIVMEEGSKANLIVECFSPYKEQSTISTDVAEIFVKNNADLNFLDFQAWGLNVYNFSEKRAILNRKSSINWTFGYFGSKLTKSKLITTLNGEGSQAKNYGLFFGIKNQHIDIFTNAVHSVPNTTYDILTKGVVKDSSVSVFRGLNKITKEAKQTNSQLTEHTLILGGEAQATSIPSLVIDNNDVQAGHASSSGQVDEEQLFYLMSRGLNKEFSEMLIVQGFFEQVIKTVKFKDIKEKFERMVKTRMGIHE